MFFLETGWPPLAHVSPIFKVERVATPIHVSCLSGDGHPLPLITCLKVECVVIPRLRLLLENGWSPPPRIVLQCIILYYTILAGVTMYVTVLYNIILYYTILYYMIMYCTILYHIVQCSF